MGLKRILALLLALMLCTAALAEEIPFTQAVTDAAEADLIEVEDDGEASVVDADADVDDAATDDDAPASVEAPAFVESDDLEAQPVDLTVEETEQEIGALEPGESADDTAEGESQMSDGDGDTEPEPDPEPVDPIYAPIPPRKITLTGSVKKNAYRNIPYQIEVPGRTPIEFRSSSTSIAHVSADGLLDLVKTGTVKITVKTAEGDKFILTLNVNKAPTPGGIKASHTRTGVYRLEWTAAKYATGYLVQASYDKSVWTDIKTLDKDKLSMKITGWASTTRYFRVKAILGEKMGGISGKVCVMPAVTGVNVICQESYLYGPTNRLNVRWKKASGAISYDVYRASLPKKTYQKIGRTTNNWFVDTRSASLLYAYRVKAIYRNAERGNVKSKASASANLWTGYQSNVYPPASLKSGTKYLLVVNKRAQVVTAYIKDADGRFRLPIRHMICSTGREYDWTENGVHKLSARTMQWLQYPSGVYIRYPSTYSEGYYFHSPLYNSNKTLRSSTVDKLGTRQSLGCVRLKVNDAEWVWRNCKAGTTVYICDGAERAKLRSRILPKTVTVH